MADTKEIIRVLGFIQEYFDNHADEQELNARKELFRDWSEIMLDTITLLKGQEPRAIKNSAGNGICPGCGHIIPAWSSPNYCGYCGQAVKWK